MESLIRFHFLRPEWLLLALPALGVWWIWRRSQDPLRGWRDQMDPELLSALAIQHDGRGDHSAQWLLVGWLLAVIAIAGPAWRPEPSPFAEDASALMILLKADASMEQKDLAPSRLERARLKIADLAEARKGQPLGLIAYAGSAHLVLPPTKDTAVVAQMATEIGPEIMPAPGDRLDLAMTLAGELIAEQAGGGSMLIVADAVDGDPEAVTESHRQAGKPEVLFLGVNSPGSSEDESIRATARAIRGKVETLSVDGTDIDAIVKGSAHPPVSRSGNAEEIGTRVRWSEAGWYLVPILALLGALAFRRETADNSPKDATAAVS